MSAKADFTAQYFKDAQKVIMGVLKKATPELMKFYGQVEYEHKLDRSVVTHLDKQIEVELKEALARFDPKAGFWGEEFGREGSRDNFWLIDPIDGTEQFIRGMDSTRNLVTYVANNQAQYALCYVFPLDILYVAERSQGTTKNGQPVKLSNRPLERAWIEFSGSLLDEQVYKIYQALRPQVAGLPRTYNSFLMLDGAVEGYFVYKSAGDVWDYAPRTLMVEAAGGCVVNIGSDKYDIYNTDFIATSPVIFDQVQKILSSLT